MTLEKYNSIVMAAILTTILIILWCGLYVFVRGLEIIID